MRFKELRVVGQEEMRGEWCAQKDYGDPVLFPIPCTMYVFHLTIPRSYPAIINW